MGGFSGNVALEADVLRTSNDTIKLLNEKDPTALPWKELEIDVAIESTEVFTLRDQIAHHLEAGAGEGRH